MFHQYIHDFLALFREETGLLALHASGEGDWKNGLARSNDIFHLVRSLDKQHMFVAEPIWRLAKLPENYTHGWDQDLLGPARTILAMTFFRNLIWESNSSFINSDVSIKRKVNGQRRISTSSSMRGSWRITGGPRSPGSELKDTARAFEMSCI